MSDQSSEKQASFYDPNQREKPVENVAASEAAPKRGRPKTQPVADPVPVEAGVTADAAVAGAAGAEPEETLDQAIERIRALRKPFGTAMQQKLALPPRIGYHRHWFNDVAGRIDEAKASGWSHVKNPRDGTPTRRVVGTGRDNQPLYGYAMELPQIFWDEHMAAVHKQAKEKVDAIKAKPFRAQAGQAQPSDQGKFYNPVEETGAGPVQVVGPGKA